LDISEFLLSKIGAAQDVVKRYDLGSLLISGILGLVAVILALSAILPPSILASLRLLLLVATIAAVFLSYWEIRRLVLNRNQRLKILRNWEKAVFFGKRQVDLLEPDKVGKMLDLIQSIEDAHTPPSDNLRYQQIDNEFMNMLK